MGYTTDFVGEVEVKPPLNRAEVEYLTKFNATRRMKRAKGPYYVDGGGSFGQAHEEDVTDFNQAPDGQPGLWCQWVPSEDGKSITWDGGEKFYSAEEWMAYIIDHFLKKGAVASIYAASTADAEQFAEFTFDHLVNGTIEAQGEDYDDKWQITVTDNKVTVATAEPTTYGDPSEVN